MNTSSGTTWQRFSRLAAGRGLSGRARWVVPTAYIATAAVAVTGVVAYAANDTTVTVTVDGQPQQVRFLGRTVEAALQKAEVSVDSEDLVVPGVEERISDGAEIIVTHARELTIVKDGVPETHTVTVTTLAEAMDVLNIRDTDGAFSVDRSTPIGREGLNVELRTPRTVTVAVDGEERPVTTTAQDLRGALTEAGIELGELDFANPALETEPTPDLRVEVIRVEHRPNERTEKIAFAKETKKSDAMFTDQKKVEQKGVVGEKLIKETIVLHNGNEVAREPGEVVTVREPVTQITVVGTKERPKPAPAPAPAPGNTAPSDGGDAAPAPAPAPPVADGSVWDRLAKCESGGNWSIDSGNGYYGGLQFSAASWRAVGGTGLPHQHSRETQIAFGKKLQARQGWGAWPACSRKLGLR